MLRRAAKTKEVPAEALEGALLLVEEWAHKEDQGRDTVSGGVDTLSCCIPWVGSSVGAGGGERRGFPTLPRAHGTWP